MPTPSERRALLFVAAVAALGLGVRGARALRRPPPDSEREALVQQIAAVDSAVTRGGRPRATARPRGTLAKAPRPQLQPQGPPSAQRPIDLDRATAEELDALPGIGPALAQRIVEDRAANGPFGSLEALQEVRGIGPALGRKLAPLVTFSAPARPPRARGTAARSSHP